MAQIHCNLAVRVLDQGGVIAYPTESVFGLGCDPFNELALQKLLVLKKRDPAKGLILVASNWLQIEPLLQPVLPEIKTRLQKTWPGAVTWVLPASALLSGLVTGNHESVAVRISAHPVVRALCETFGGAIVSSSANISKRPPATTAIQVRKKFGAQIDYLVPGMIGDLKKPTEIRDALSGNIIRAG